MYCCIVQVSIQLLQDLLKKGDGEIPWHAVHHLVGEICFGGKVTDPQDVRALRALLVKTCSPSSINEGYGSIQVTFVR